MSAPQLICLFALSLLVGKTAYGQPAEPAQPGKSAEEVHDSSSALPIGSRHAWEIGMHRHT